MHFEADTRFTQLSVKTFKNTHSLTGKDESEIIPHFQKGTLVTSKPLRANDQSKNFPTCF